MQPIDRARCDPSAIRQPSPANPLRTAAVRSLQTSFETASKDARWFEREGVLVVENQRKQLVKAIEDIIADKKEPTSGRIVAALSFSFWTTMLGRDYENLWQTTLHRIGRREDGKGLTRKELSRPLTPIRTLRNRIAHHESIIMWNLPEHYKNILRIVGWLSPPAAEWCKILSRFDDVYPTDGIVLMRSIVAPSD